MGTAIHRALAPDGGLALRRDLRHAPARRWTAWTCSPCATAWAGGRARASDRRRRSSRSRTYRFRGHSMRDPAGSVYRTKEEVEREKRARPHRAVSRDRCLPGGRRSSRGRRHGPSRRRSTTEVDEAVAFAEASPEPPPDELLTDVYEGLTPWPVMTYREALNQALREEMRPRPARVRDGRGGRALRRRLQGDPGAAQGVRRASASSTRRSASPASPASASGAAMLGPAPGDRDDDVQLLASSPSTRSSTRRRRCCYMSGGQYHIPIVVRGPGGPAAQLAAQHSQSMETYFYHVPGLKVVRPVDARRRQGPAQVGHPRRQPGDLHRGRDALRGQGRGARGSRLHHPAGQGRRAPRGHGRHRGRLHGHDVPRDGGGGGARQGGDLGGDRGSPHAPAHGHRDHRRRRCGRPTAAVVLEAGAGFAGMGSEIAAEITETAFDDLDAPVDARHRRERPHAVREEPRAAQDPVARPRSRRRSGRSATA